MNPLTAISPAIGSGRFTSDHHVLAAYLGETDLPGTSRYSDDVWFLGPAERLGHAKRGSLHFETLPAPFRGVAKELHALFLERRLALTENGRPPSLSTVRGRFSAVKDFTWYLDSIGIQQLRHVTAKHLAEYVGMLRRRGRLWSRYLAGVRTLWLYREHLSDGLVIDPESVPMWVPVNKRRAAENATDRIPAEVLDPLIWWASTLVSDLSEDIIEASEEFNRLYDTTRGGTGVAMGLANGSSLQRLRDLIEQFRESGEKLPGHPVGRRVGTVNVIAMERLAGVQRGTTRPPERAAMRDLGAVNGVDTGLRLRSRPRSTIEGVRWSDGFTYDEVPNLVRALHTAAYTLIAFFSGMRDSEVKHLRMDCGLVDTDRTGKLTVHLVQGATFKGNSEPTGESATWVVAPIVHDAITVLRSLLDPQEDRLFRPIRAGRNSYGRASPQDLISSKETNDSLASMILWINELHARTGIGPSIPDVNGKPWRLTTRQFRRTLAWFIARRPSGIAAGALQYKHLSIQMFRGYAGASASGFAEEVAAEQAVARGEWLGDFAADAETAVGRARDEVVRRLDSWERTVGFRGHLPESPRQLARLLKRHDPHVYRGDAVTCVFDPAKALCLSKARMGDAPDLQACDPLRCGNSVFTPDQVATWRDRAAGMLALSANETLAPYVRARAREHADRLTHLFDKLEGAS